MADFELRVYADDERFTDDWQALGYDTTETEQYWALLGELKPGEVLLQLPEWLAEEKTGYIDGATPTAFVGRIDEETAKAIRVTGSAAAQPLSRIASRIAPLEESIIRLQEESNPDTARVGWLERRLDEKRTALDARENIGRVRK